MQTCTCIGLYPSTYTWVCVCIFYKRAIQLKSSIFLLDAINLMTKKSIINVCVWSQVFGSMNRTLSLDSCSSIFEVSIFKHPLQSVSQLVSRCLPQQYLHVKVWISLHFSSTIQWMSMSYILCCMLNFYCKCCMQHSQMQQTHIHSYEYTFIHDDDQHKIYKALTF